METAMADVWFVKDGSASTVGEEPFQKLSLADCIKQLGLSKNHHLCDLSSTPRFGEAGPMGAFRGPQHVVVQIEETEAKANGWQPGFYSTPVSPEEARQRLRPRGTPDH
jgi:hypothetical protein